MDFGLLVLYERVPSRLTSTDCLGPHGIWNLHQTAWMLIYPHVVWGQHENVETLPCEATHAAALPLV